MTNELVTHFDSESEAYRDAFDTFLRSTDQKVKARAWLKALVGDLPRRRVFIDAGAGEGTTTAWVADHFDRTLAIEPNESLRQRLAHSCPGAPTVSQNILDVRPDAKADLVLCSHVFYYLDDEAWDENLAQLASWLAPGGTLVVAIQNPTSDCMLMLRTFFGRRDGLGDLMRRFQHSASPHFDAWIDKVPCHIRAADLETAYTTAEFIVNTRPDGYGLRRAALEAYVESEFRLPDGEYRFSCTQDFLRSHGTTAVLPGQASARRGCGVCGTSEERKDLKQRAEFRPHRSKNVRSRGGISAGIVRIGVRPYLVGASTVLKTQEKPHEQARTYS